LRICPLYIADPPRYYCGIEAKAAATAGRADFHDLRLMRERLGERFAFGALLYTGPATVPFGDRLAAIPLQGLWTDVSPHHDAPAAPSTGYQA
jgi:hypothetical protein